MSDSVAVLLTLAPPAVVRQLVTRGGDRVRKALRSKQMPVDVINAVIDSGDRAGLRALADNAEFVRNFPEPALRLATSADDEIIFTLVANAQGQHVVDALLDAAGPINWVAAMADQKVLDNLDLVKALVRRPDCPVEFQLAVVHGLSVTALAERERGVEPSVLQAVVAAKDPFIGSGLEECLAALIRSSLESGKASSEQLLSMLPAAAICAALAYDCGELRYAARSLLVARLGSDPRSWKALLDSRLEWHAGLAELLEAATVSNQKLAEGPSDFVGESIIRQLGEKEIRQAVSNLLNCCPIPVQLAALSSFDEEMLSVFFARQIHPALFGGLVDSGPHRLLVALAQGKLSGYQLERLLDMNDPYINASLLMWVRRVEERGAIKDEDCLRSEYDRPWQRVISRGQRLAVTPRLHKLLVDGIQRGDPFGLKIGLVLDSVDSVFARELLTHHHLSGQLQLRLLLAVARHEGPSVARAFFEADWSSRKYAEEPWDSDVRGVVEAAFMNVAGNGGPDGRAALAELSAAVEEWSRPHRWIAREREVESSTYWGLIRHEKYEHDWLLLLREHGRKPFSASALARILDLPDCPPEVDEFLWDEILESDAPGGRKPLLEDSEYYADYVETILWEEQEAWRHPGLWARSVPELLAAIREVPSKADVFLAHIWEHGMRYGSTDPVRQFFRDSLGDDPDAWLLAVQLVSGFSGTLPELLTASSAAVRGFSGGKSSREAGR